MAVPTMEESALCSQLMKDQTEMVLTPNNPLGDTVDTEALAKKYLDNADIVDMPEGEFSEVAEGAESPKIK